MSIESILEFAQTWWPVLTATVAVAAAVAAVTPTKVDNKVVKVVLKVINFLGLNVLKAKNADDR